MRGFSFVPRWLRDRRRRAGVLVAGALLAAVGLPGLLRLETDNSPDVFFVRGSQDVERYRAFRDELGSDLVVRLVARGDGLWTPHGLSWLAELERRAGEVAGVESVAGLYQHHGRDGWPASEAEVAAFRERVLSNRLDRAAGWVARDGSIVTVTAALEELPRQEERRLLDRLRDLLASTPAGITAELAGPPLLNHALDDSSREIEMRYFPLLVVFAVILLAATLRGGAGFLKPLLFVGLCEILVLAPMSWSGARLNMVLAVLPPLLFAIALATALHVLLRFRDLRDEGFADPVEACLETYRDKGWSVLWTGLTTLLAFASLMVSPVAPVRSLGLWAALALGLMTAAAFLVYPALLTLPLSHGAPRSRPFERAFHRLGASWGAWAGRHPRLVLLSATALALLAIAGWPGIQVQSNALLYLAEDHPVRTRIERLEGAGIGLSAIEVVLEPPGAAPFEDGETVARLAELGERFEEEPLVFGALSAGTVLQDTADRLPAAPFLSPPERRSLVLRGLEADPEGRRVLERFLSADRERARVTVFLATVGLDELEPLLATLRGLALASFPGARIEVTGEFLLLLEAQRHLLSTLALSLGLTLVAVAAVLRWVLPGNRLTLLALLPNLWPVVGTLGVMGWLGVPLDIATVMVASVALGLAVDDTLHTLGHFRELAPSLGAREGVARTLEVTAPAYVLTGVILAAGFGVCAFSDFAPVARFGALSALAIGLAVLGDLFLLPALLSLTPRSTLERWGNDKLATMKEEPHAS